MLVSPIPDHAETPYNQLLNEMKTLQICIMRSLLSNSGSLRILVLSTSLLSLIMLGNFSAVGQCPGPGTMCPPLAPGVPGGFVNCRIKKIQADINPWIKSYMEIKPVDYESNPTRKYPLIVYLGGTGEMFQVPNNNTVELCHVLYWSMPSRINSGQFPNEVVFNGQSYSYFVVMPFAQQATNPDDPHWWDPIDPGAMIDWVLSHYPGRIDVTRIYLTGMSRGTENIMGWLTQSVNNARRIAAAFIVANCYPSSVTDFNQRVSNLAASNVHLWGLSCSLDQVCSPTSIQAYVNGVNALNPNHALYTGYTDPPPPSTIDYCQGPNAGWHYAWNFAYSPDENRPASTGGKNPYEWMIQFSQNISLPVILKDWRARLDKGNVLLEWTTTDEINSKEFVIQRSTASGTFENILRTPAAIASSTERNYSLVDEHPLPGESLYRLVLIDQDGKEQYFPIKSIIVPGVWKENVIIPNPVADGLLNVYLNVSKTQRITIRLVDLQGRVLSKQEKQLLSGQTQYQINVSSLQKGVYLVQIIGDDFKTAKKVSID